MTDDFAAGAALLQLFVGISEVIGFLAGTVYLWGVIPEQLGVTNVVIQFVLAVAGGVVIAQVAAIAVVVAAILLFLVFGGTLVVINKVTA